jgi:hypothetical protein
MPPQIAVQVARLVVIGGGVDGALYVRQLLRAQAAGRLVTEAIHVVDRDPACAVSALSHPRVRLELADWGHWLSTRLDEFAADDHLVPYHWAPHLFFDWLEGQVRHHGARTARGAELPALGVPFERTLGTGARALSYATWTCPATCIEPALCPHTRGPRDWHLDADLAQAGAAQALVFRCLHLVYGVASVPIGALFEARQRVLSGLVRGRQSYRIATSSHCHALAAQLDVEPGPATFSATAS